MTTDSFQRMKELVDEILLEADSPVLSWAVWQRCALFGGCTAKKLSRGAFRVELHWI
jgi:hypothetical protein